MLQSYSSILILFWLLLYIILHWFSMSIEIFSNFEVYLSLISYIFHHRCSNQCLTRSLIAQTARLCETSLYQSSLTRMRSAMDTLFVTLSLTLTLLLDEIHVGTTHWKWIPHKVVRPTWVSSNKRVSVRESARKRVFLAFL